MLFDNPIFAGWYTDTVDIYRVVTEQKGNISSQARKKINAASIPCRVYSSKRDGPVLTGTAAAERSTEKMACDLSVDIQAGDELEVIRGGGLGIQGKPERYFAVRAALLAVGGGPQRHQRLPHRRSAAGFLSSLPARRHHSGSATG